MHLATRYGGEPATSIDLQSILWQDSAAGLDPGGAAWFRCCVTRRSLDGLCHEGPSPSSAACSLWRAAWCERPDRVRQRCPATGSTGGRWRWRVPRRTAWPDAWPPRSPLRVPGGCPTVPPSDLLVRAPADRRAGTALPPGTHRSTARNGGLA